MSIGSTPSLTEFNPREIPFQFELIHDVRRGLDYNEGAWELLASGAVGSAKSMVAAHLAITHCLMYEHAQVLIGRKTMPSLRDTLLQRIIDHLGNDVPYELNRSRGIFSFPNGSRIIPYSWSDGNYKKVRSLELSAAIIEELTENDEPEFYEEIVLRVGRLSHVPEKFVLSVTNPDDPTHWAYSRFISQPKKNTKVYYSKTADNPFLPQSYVSKLEETLDPKMARRMLYGEWLSIAQEVIYYAYSQEHNYRRRKYEINPRLPIRIAFDFNIGIGKPMSATLFQYDSTMFHFFDEIIIEGARTEDVLEEIYGRGYFDLDTEFKIHGDATGKHRDTRSRHSDYTIIRDWLNNVKNSRGEHVRFSIEVPLSNPKVRDRHNKVNALLQNAKGERRLFVYEPCKVLDEGLRLTKLKDRAGYIEDDGPHYQHVTTALGYGVCWVLEEQNKSEIRQLR